MTGPGEADASELAAAVESFFAARGALERALDGYEPRSEQVVIARAVAHALATRTKLLAEAGTGTGKTLAYLVPAVLSGRRFVISTATKTLQDQIVRVDVPLASRALGRQLTVRAMKGRSNYLCRTRAARFFAQPTLPGIDDADLLPTLAAWAEATATGDRADIAVLADQSPLWRELSATSEQCTGRACAHFERCFVTQMRRQAEAADVVVVNHHLYFAELGLKHRAGDPSLALLPAHESVIFDEAHELEEVGAQHFGSEVSEWRFVDFGRDLRRATSADATANARMAVLTAELERRARHLFDALTWDGVRRTLSLSVPGDEPHGRWRSVDAHLLRMREEIAALAFEEAAALARRASQLAAELRFVLAGTEAAEPGSKAPTVEARGRSERPTGLAREDAPAFVRYTEMHGHTRTVVARPIDIAPILREQLEPLSAVFISATLSVGGDFGFARERLGIRRATEVVVDSPFDYRRQAMLYVPDDLPDADTPGFAARAAERAAELVASSGGGAFVLCTSHRMLGVMREAMLGTGLPIRTQGEAPKSVLLEEFKSAGDAVLCATLSFWQGVDVPGQALRLVVIDKLPFASPADPVVAARLEHLRQRELDPFTTYQIPQAALLLRQGFGRLIRRQTDEGVVALLDRRVLTRRYGALLLASLPACIRVEDRTAALARLEALRRSVPTVTAVVRRAPVEHRPKVAPPADRRVR